jgi:peptide/nickel transport system permease protein
MRSTGGRVGFAVGLVVLGVIVFGRFLTPYPPNAIGVGPPTSPPTAEHLLGTDQLGRDVLSRTLVGGNTIIVIPLVAVTLAFVIGALVGMLGAYRAGRLDMLMIRGIDVFLTVPPLLLVLVLIAGLGSSEIVLGFTLVLVYAPRVARIARGATQGVVTSEYVSAAQARGERTLWILWREILPNISSPLIADFALRVTYGVIFIATLNFLGLGVQPPDADWGVMVAEGRGFINIVPTATLAPAAAIALLSISLNLFADALTQHANREWRGNVVL